MAISRMQQPRQQYGLGSLVKSIGKGVKKFVKSPLGKAALLGLGGAGLMGMGPFSGLAGIGSRIGGALFGGAGIGPAGKLGTSKGILSSIMGKIPGGGYTLGAIGSILAASGMGPEEIEATKRDPEKLKIYLRDYYSKTNPDASDDEVNTFVETNVSEYATGGRVGLYAGDTAQAAGIMGNLPVRQNKAGVNELDLRNTGGFIPPVGVKEKADDVPAMLSNNEFVFTADAVRAAGGGSVNKGAQLLYDKMKQLESRVG